MRKLWGAQGKWGFVPSPRQFFTIGVGMKARNPVIPEEVGKRLLLRCMICDKSVEGFYARFGDSGVCSGKCMKVQDQKPRYPGHSEEEFFNRLKGSS